jgi:hypothetical protein
MNLKSKIKKELKKHYGGFDSYLEQKYVGIVTENLINGDFEDKQAWLTYNQVILEFKNNLRNMLKVKELQYKLTDNLNPNEVCINVLEETIDRTPELERLYRKIINFSK